MAARAEFQYDDLGQHRTVIGTAESAWTRHTQLSRQTINGVDYYGASLFFLGQLPCERVFTVQTLPTTITDSTPAIVAEREGR